MLSAEMLLFLPQISIFDYNSFASDKNKGTQLKGLIVERPISVSPVYLHNCFSFLTLTERFLARWLAIFINNKRKERFRTDVNLLTGECVFSVILVFWARICCCCCLVLRVLC